MPLHLLAFSRSGWSTQNKYCRWPNKILLKQKYLFSYIHDFYILEYKNNKKMKYWSMNHVYYLFYPALVRIILSQIFNMYWLANKNLFYYQSLFYTINTLNLVILNNQFKLLIIQVLYINKWNNIPYSTLQMRIKLNLHKYAVTNI